ncbi:bifunctional diguanylate cyclase/phosphodiesterase [uncultured Roseibium sp.]|uniref:putative bifunctional diguanylate cyclase/phosphodiesterase n=1 Tax=uncultured Roseibium sp. TaxID=1936171 RepID=UPI002593BCDE|nr:bifunctional diguanylate cyclase/phosphodiesterase [uncultured Roseibium sp.]
MNRSVANVSRGENGDAATLSDVTDKSAILNRLEAAIWVFDVDESRVVWANQAALAVWDAPDLEELQARNLKADMSPSVSQRVKQFQADFIEHDASFSEVWTLYPQGVPKSLRVRYVGIELDDGRMAMLCEGHDEVVEQPETIRSSDALLHTQLMISLHHENGEALYLNPAARAAFDAPNAHLHSRFVRKRDFDKLLKALRTDGQTSIITKVATTKGERWHEVTARTCHDPVSGVPSIHVSETDVSDLKEAEARAKSQAYTDPLTGLPNRIHLPILHQQMTAQAEADGDIVGVFFIDLDQFKAINDTLGHSHGDTMLIRVAKRLRAICEGTDKVVRLGGDEFLLLATVPEDDPQQLCNIAGKILEALSLPVRHDGRKLSVTPSIGIARWPQDGETAQELMKNADLAMYQAKAAGRNRFRHFDARMKQDQETELETLTDIREGLKRADFVAYYQPRVDLATNRIVAVEALARWNHPKRGLIMPDAFIGLCEKTGLINDLGLLILRDALKQQKSWRSQGIEIFVSVNVSQRQLSSFDFAEQVQDALQEFGCDSSGLELEMTETLLVEGDKTVHQNLKALRKLGVKIAIDDFGTGYSNFSRLNDMAADCVKIDRSLIRDLPRSEPIVKMMIAMCKLMKVSIVAEGIENAELEAKVRDLGCDEIQGFYCAKPMTATNMTEHLQGDMGVEPPSRSTK